jgi:hypothetical protein
MLQALAEQQRAAAESMHCMFAETIARLESQTMQHRIRQDMKVCLNTTLSNFVHTYLPKHVLDQL